MDADEIEVCGERCIHPLAVARAEAALPPEEEMAEMAELFKAFADSTRVRMLNILLLGEMCVCDLAELLRVTQPAASYQLKVLKRAGLVKSRRDGTTIFYSLADRHVETIIGMAREHLEEETK